MHDDSPSIPDLRPSPWPIHGGILAALAVGYLLLASAAWPAQPPTPTDRLGQGMSVLTGIGQGAAIGAILMGGVLVLLYAAITTAIVGWVRNPWLVHGLALAAGLLAILIASR